MHLKIKQFKTSDGKSHSVIATSPDQVMRNAEPQRSITVKHADSLSCLVNYFRRMIEHHHITQSPGRSDELTMEYCDELLEDLND